MRALAARFASRQGDCTSARGQTRTRSSLALRPMSVAPCTADAAWTGCRKAARGTLDDRRSQWIHSANTAQVKDEYRETPFRTSSSPWPLLSEARRLRTSNATSPTPIRRTSATCLMCMHQVMRRICPWSSGFTAGAGRRATSRACRSSRKPSWTKGSSSSPRITGCTRTSTWGRSCATSPSRSTGSTTMSAEQGSDQESCLFVMGHSAGAPARRGTVCTDDRNCARPKACPWASSKAACPSMGTPTMCRPSLRRRRPVVVCMVSRN